ncbi:MAG: sulfotransferase domain-containing protein [Acidobacteriota bacterium]
MPPTRLSHLVERSSSAAHLLLDRAGLRSRWQPRGTGLDGIREDDTFLVSFPRSGSNWTRLLLCNLRWPDREHNLATVNELFPSMHAETRCDFSRVESPRFLKTHYPAYRRFPRFVYVVRDPRDVMISYHRYQYGMGNFESDVTLSGFLRTLGAQWPIDWSRHVDRALEAAAARPAETRVLRYEDLKADPHGELEKLAAFCSLPTDSAAIERSVQRCEFSRLQKSEATAPHRQNFRGSFFRKGSSGQWTEELTPEDIEWLERRHGKTMRRLGYEPS